MKNLNIAVIVQNKPFFGAVIAQIPFLSGLRIKHPNSSITILSPVKTAILFKQLALCDEIFFFHNSKANLAKYISSNFKRFDFIYSLRKRSELSFIMSLLLGKYRVGYLYNNKYPIFNRSVSFDKNTYIANNYVKLLKDYENNENLSQMFKCILTHFSKKKENYI